MCEMLAMYELVQYSDAIDEEKKSNYKLQGLALAMVYPQCNEPAPPAEPERQLPVTAVLENDEWYELEEVGCQGDCDGQLANYILKWRSSVKDWKGFLWMFILLEKAKRRKWTRRCT